MTNEKTSAAAIAFPGNKRADDWTGAFERGVELDGRFPNQDAEDFAIACRENGYPDDVVNVPITFFQCIKHGENDGDSWVWAVNYANGAVYRFEGSCDYTGWDCQSSLDWERR